MVILDYIRTGTKKKGIAPVENSVSCTSARCPGELLWAGLIYTYGERAIHRYARGCSQEFDAWALYGFASAASRYRPAALV
jgi:hypothetical protein